MHAAKRVVRCCLMGRAWWARADGVAAVGVASCEEHASSCSTPCSAWHFIVLPSTEELVRGARS